MQELANINTDNHFASQNCSRICSEFILSQRGSINNSFDTQAGDPWDKWQLCTLSVCYKNTWSILTPSIPVTVQSLIVTEMNAVRSLLVTFTAVQRLYGLPVFIRQLYAVACQYKYRQSLLYQHNHISAISFTKHRANSSIARLDRTDQLTASQNCYRYLYFHNEVV